MGGPERLPRLAVSHVGHSAGVDHMNVRLLRRRHQPETRLDQPTGQDFAVGRIELASVGFYGHGAYVVGDTVAVGVSHLRRTSDASRCISRTPSPILL